MINLNINEEILLGLLLNIRQRNYVLSKSEDQVKKFIKGLANTNDVNEHFSKFYLQHELKAWI